MRKIPKNDSSAVPRYMVFFDTESKAIPLKHRPNASRHVLRLGVAIIGRWRDGKLTNRQVIRFSRPAQFWRVVKKYLRPRQTVWLFAHNIGFDLTLCNMWELMDRQHFEISAPGRKRKKDMPEGEQNRTSSGIFVTSSPPTIIGLQHKTGGRLVCVDTLNYWRTSLKEIGKWVGIEKQEFPGLDTDAEELFKYCQNDVEICEAAVCKLIDWVETNDLGMFRYTAPGQAYSAFRHRFMKHDIWPREDVKIKAHERAGYFGGQYLLFKYGLIEGPIYQYDVNGLYPAAMQDELFPVDLIRHFKVTRLTRDRPVKDLSKLVATVEVDTDQLVPHRLDDGSVEYCTGNLVVTLCGPELVWLDSLGHIKRWGSWSKYKMAPLFKDWVKYWWPLRTKHRQAGDKVSDGLCKMFLNSLPGKFGQKSPIWKHRPEVVLDNLWGKHLVPNTEQGGYRTFRAISGEAFEEMPPGEKSDNFPAISGFVCSYGRERMRQIREVAGAGNIYYQAVDSIAVSEQGKANLWLAGMIDEYELGKLKLQCTGDTAYFQAISQYRVGEKQVNSGLKRSAVKQEDGTYNQLQFENLDSILHGKPPPGVTVIEVNKSFTTARIRGTVGSDNWVTPPHYEARERD